jgi:hypothetical protein
LPSPLPFADELLELSQVEEHIVLADEPVTDPCPVHPDQLDRSRRPRAFGNAHFLRDD